MSQDVLYITIDSIRADRVGYLGYDGETTPTIDRLATEGTSFTQGIANGIPTYYSFKSLLGGIHSLSHSQSIGLPETATSIAEVFREAGYATAGFNAQNPWLTPGYGYDRGFETFEDFMSGTESGAETGQLIRRTKRLAKRAVAFSDTLTDALGQLGRIASVLADSQPLVQAEVVTDAATEWLSSRDRDQPFFLWIHYMDPHYPWTPPKEFLRTQDGADLSQIDIGRLWHTVAYQYQRENASIDEQTLRQINQLYDAELRRMDATIDRLVDTAVSNSEGGEPLIAVAGDHGTELNDHGGFSHGPRKLYQEVTHVPFLFYGPNISSAKRDLGALVDIPQTLAQHSGAVESPVEAFAGKNILEKDRNRVITEIVYDIDPVRQENTTNDLLQSHMDPPFKLIRNKESGRVELYDLESDPDEGLNLASEHPTLASELTEELDAHQAKIKRQNRTIAEKQRIRRVVANLRDEGAI
jgi:arylsulfatase A-like enzyme